MYPLITLKIANSESMENTLHAAETSENTTFSKTLLVKI